MWKVLGYISLWVICIIPGAVAGAVCGGIYLPIKVCSMIADSGNGDATNGDEI